LATVKYKILLAPLFVAHIYKHKDREDYAERVAREVLGEQEATSRPRKETTN
jgi:hypothetical protein